MSQLTEKQIEVIKAAAQACESSGLALNLKREFPEAFLFNIKDYIAKIGDGRTIYGMSIIVYNDSHIFIPLPKANRDWSFAAFRLAEKYCTSTPNNVSMYPIHGAMETAAIQYARNSATIDKSSNYLVLSYSIHY
jgi:hypothetical protein